VLGLAVGLGVAAVLQPHESGSSAPASVQRLDLPASSAAGPPPANFTPAAQPPATGSAREAVQRFLAARAGGDLAAAFGQLDRASRTPITGLTHDHVAPSNADDPNAIIGVYATSQRQRVRVLSDSGATPEQSGRWVQVSRLGMPLVNEVVIPLGRKDRFNASDPRDDAQFLRFVADPEPARLIPVLYPGVTVPAAPRDDLTDVELRALAGGTPLTPDFNKAPNNQLGDGVNANDTPFLAHFPYVATPHQGYASDPHYVTGSLTTP